VHRDIVLIGGSAGSIEVITQTIGELAPEFPAALFVVVHFPAAARSTLPQIITRAGTLPARHARHGDPVLPGQVYVARPNCHMVLADGVVQLTSGPRARVHR
jgi:two-component system chemotaxis response regulator CheB